MVLLILYQTAVKQANHFERYKAALTFIKLNNLHAFRFNFPNCFFPDVFQSEQIMSPDSTISCVHPPKKYAISSQRSIPMQFYRIQIFIKATLTLIYSKQRCTRLCHTVKIDDAGCHLHPQSVVRHFLGRDLPRTRSFFSLTNCQPYQQILFARLSPTKLTHFSQKFRTKYS